MRRLVSILIPTHNREMLIAQVLASLRAVQVPEDDQVEVIVVANACSDGTEGIVRTESARMPFPTRCVVESRLGLNVARNRGVEEARGELLAFLDDDVWVEPGWLTGLLAVFDTHPADVVGGRVILWWKDCSPPSWLSPVVVDRLSANDHGDRVIEYQGRNLAIGANVAFRRKLFDVVGRFRSGLDRTGSSLLGGGETDLIRRAMRAGFRFFYAPDAVVKHWVAPERIEWPYLSRAAFGEAQASILALEEFGPGVVAYQTMGRLYRLLRHGTGEIVGRVARNEGMWVDNRMMRMHAMGGFAGIWQRLTGRSALPG